MTPERLVVVLGSVFGLLFLVVTPPYQAPDEPHHVNRAFYLSEGHLGTPDDGLASLPASLAAAGEPFLHRLPFQPDATTTPGEVLAAWRLPLDPGVRREVWVFGAYTPLAYLPQAVGALAARALGMPALAVLYLARLANLAACLALAWAAVRVAPFFRWTLALLALTPMALFLRSSASPDALTNAFCALLLAAVLALGWGGERRRGAVLLLFTAALAVGLSKGGGYALLSLLVLLVPAGRLASSRVRAAALVAGLLALTAAGFALSVWTARSAYDASHLRPGAALDPEAQAAGVLARPVRFAGLVARDYLWNGPRYLFQFVGNLGWLDVPMPLLAAGGWALLLLLLAMADGPAGPPLTLRQRLVIGLPLAGILALLSLSQYLTWTPVRADRIEGLQGRYFIPAAPLALLLFTRRRTAAAGPAGTGSPFSPRAGWLLSGAAAALLTTALLTTVLRYYVD